MEKLHYKKFNDLSRRIRENADWFDEFIGIVKEYYKEELCGGSLHIVLDDGNISKDCVNWCAGYACGKGDDVGGNIANLMLHMTWRQRKKVYDSNLYQAHYAHNI